MDKKKRDEIIEEFKELFRPGTENYACYDILINLLDGNKSFREKIKKGMNDGKIHGFSDELWNKLNNQNLRFRGINDFDDIFRNGFNLGYCTPCSKQVSYSFDNCFICGGILPILKGTTNCTNGEHTWIESNNIIIDTSLMLVIDSSLREILGYIKENEYNPNDDPIYRTAKDFANDPTFKSKSV